jgi:hypothetical protein
VVLLVTKADFTRTPRPYDTRPGEEPVFFNINGKDDLIDLAG